MIEESKKPQDFFQNDEETADETMEADDQTEIDDGNKEDVTTNEFMTSLQTVRNFLQKTGARIDFLTNDTVVLELICFFHASNWSSKHNRVA